MNSIDIPNEACYNVHNLIKRAGYCKYKKKEVLSILRKRKLNKKTNKESLSASKWELFLRRWRWIFSKSGSIPLAFEHFLAMIPATILVPVLVNNTFDMVVIDVSLVLFTSGIGTILFTVLSRGTIPAYLGSSFAYIGLTVYLVEQQVNGGVPHAMAFSYVGWAYIFSGILLVLLSFLYRKKGIERLLSFLLPATVIGPAISLIGLELADTAIVDSGFDVINGMVDGHAAAVAITTLVVIVLFSLLRHKILKNAAIIVGILVGCGVFFALEGFPAGNFSNLQWFKIPSFHLPLLTVPKNLLGLLVAVIPATFIVFTENIGRITVIGRMTETTTKQGESPAIADAELEQAEVIDDDTGENDLFTEHSVKKMQSSLFSHGVATFAAGLLGSVPNTIYAENIAVMSIHHSDMKRDDPDPFIQKLVAPCSVIPYILASCIAIIFSFVGVLQTFLLGIPKPVIGGMELFLFGIISAPGIQLLVEQRVNYKKVSNQIVTAAVLISGISGLSVNLGFVELKGMGLGFVVGVLLNLIVQLLKWLGSSSDTISFEEALCECLTAFSDTTSFRILGYKKEGEVTLDNQRNCSIGGIAYALRGKDCRVRMANGQWLSDDTIRDELNHTEVLEIGLEKAGVRDTVFKFRRTSNGLFVDIRSDYVQDTIKNEYLNDYEAIDEDGNWLLIRFAEDIPFRRIRALIREIDAACSSTPLLNS